MVQPIEYQQMLDRNPKVIEDTYLCLGGGWRLHLQYYHYGALPGVDAEESGYGYRFINSHGWNFKPQKGQARIPSRKYATRLWAQADLEGWADYHGEEPELEEP